MHEGHCPVGNIFGSRGAKGGAVVRFVQRSYNWIVDGAEGSAGLRTPRRSVRRDGGRTGEEEGRHPAPAAGPTRVEQRWALELEALAPVADIIEIRADTPAEFAAGAADVDAIITSWGLRIDRQVIGA